MTEPGDYWTIERGDGWTRISRDPNKPYVTVLTDTKSCHVHFWTYDAEMDAQGFGIADLVCHGCDTATRVLYPPFDEEQAKAEPLWPTRAAFAADHRECVHLGTDFLCPPKYQVSKTIDLRDAPEKEEPDA